MTKIFASIVTIGFAITLASCSSGKKVEGEAAVPSKMACTPAAKAPKLLWSLPGFSNPESAVYDASTKAIYVSNVAGGPTDKDGKGWIDKVSLKGKMIQAKWATGEVTLDPKVKSPLNAPKGIAIRDGILWVADIDRVAGFQLKTGKQSVNVVIPGSEFLNDVTFDPKAPAKLFVSDMTGGALYVIEKSPAFALVAKGPQLEMPNGLKFVDGKLFMAGWGADLNKDFSTRIAGRIINIDPTSQAVTPWTGLPLGNLDGLESEAPDTMLVSDWLAGKVYRVKKTGECTLLLEGIGGAADIGWIADKRILLLPRMVDNKLEAYQL